MTNQFQPQIVPVRVYQTIDHLILAAPMPGLEPQDISIIINNEHITIQSQPRGPCQDERDLLIAEWKFGFYYREVILPQPVNATLTNATYNNGVLVLSMPKMEPGKRGVSAEFGLKSISSTQGERVGHSGCMIEPTTTQEHWQKVHQVVEIAGKEKSQPHSLAELDRPG